VVAIAGGVNRVLIVDDDEILRRSLARGFYHEGIEALTASTYDEALAHVESKPDVAVVDLFLAVPENGIELLKRLKAAQPSLFCILMSAHMSVAHAVLGIRAGADDVFLKPVTAKQVLTRIAKGPRTPEVDMPSLQQIEWEHIARALHDYDGNITHAAEALGIMRQSLQRKILRHAPRSLERPVFGGRKRRKRRAPSSTGSPGSPGSAGSSES
jgi:two-component system response regulator RegA